MESIRRKCERRYFPEISRFPSACQLLVAGMTVQIPYIDRLTRKLVQSLSEAWNEQRSIQNVVVTTARVDGNLVKNYISYIKSRGVVKHYTHSILIYRNTDSRLLLYDYSRVEDKLVFMAAANEEFTMNELEDISGAEIYHCSRDDGGKFKEGAAVAHPRFRLLEKLAKHLKPIRKKRDGSFLKASSKCRLHYCPGLCAKLKRHPSQLGCWKHLISGRPPTTEDAERLLEAKFMEVLALLTLWYQDPFYFQLSYESVLNPELRMSYLPCMTPVLGHVAYSVPPNVDVNQMYSHVPDPFEKRTALVTVVAHKNHRCWNRRLLWGGPLVVSMTVPLGIPYNIESDACRRNRLIVPACALQIFGMVFTCCSGHMQSETLKSSQYGRSSRVRDPGWVRYVVCVKPEILLNVP